MKRFLYITMFVLTASVASYAQALTTTSLSTKKFLPPSDFVYVMDSMRVLTKIPLTDAPTLLTAIERAGGLADEKKIIVNLYRLILTVNNTDRFLIRFKLKHIQARGVQNMNLQGGDVIELRPQKVKQPRRARIQV